MQIKMGTDIEILQDNLVSMCHNKEKYIPLVSAICYRVSKQI